MPGERIDIDSRAKEMLKEDIKGTMLKMRWSQLPDAVREAYRDSAIAELFGEARRKNSLDISLPRG